MHQDFLLSTCTQPENHSVPSYCICIYFPLCRILLILGDKIDQFSYRFVSLGWLTATMEELVKHVLGNYKITFEVLTGLCVMV